MGTKSTFEQCLGKEFVVESLDEYGSLELNVSAVTGVEFESIWIEPEFVELVT